MSLKAGRSCWTDGAGKVSSRFDSWTFKILIVWSEPGIHCFINVFVSGPIWNLKLALCSVLSISMRASRTSKLVIFWEPLNLQEKKIPCHVRRIIPEADPLSLNSRIGVKMRNVCSTHYLVIKKNLLHFDVAILIWLIKSTNIMSSFALGVSSGHHKLLWSWKKSLNQNGLGWVLPGTTDFMF